MNDSAEDALRRDLRIQGKQDAQRFLIGFEMALNESLAPAFEMEREIRRTVAGARNEHSERHLRQPEAAFLNKFAVPMLYQQIGVYAPNLTDEEKSQALLNEYHPSMKSISCGSPWHKLKHPFTKVRSATAESIYQRWAEDPKKALAQSCPDFAVRRPFPHKIIFEGKYFSNGSLAYAERVLVNDIYQAFFYRGLPFAEETSRGRAAWDYDYACLIAYARRRAAR